MDFPNHRFPPLNTINSFSYESLGGQLRPGLNLHFQNATVTTFVANEILYIPFRIYEPSTAVRLSYLVGNSNGANVDLGIYDSQKNKLVSTGSTTMGSVSTCHDIDITDTLLYPGVYYMALQASAVTGSRYGVGSFDEAMNAMDYLLKEAAGSFGLPTTATWVRDTASSPSVPIVGVHFDTLV